MERVLLEDFQINITVNKYKYEKSNSLCGYHYWAKFVSK